MLNRNAQYQEWLLPYLEEGLDEARRTQLEARLAADPDLAAEAERLRRTLSGLRGTAARTPSAENAQVPAGLWPHLQARLVLEPTPRPRIWWVAGLGAPAAAALIVAAVWLPGWHALEMRPKPPAAGTKAPAPRAVTSAAPSASVRDAPGAAVTRPAAKKVGVPGRPQTRPAAAPPDPFALPHSATPATKGGAARPTSPAVSTRAVKPAGPTAPVPRPTAEAAPNFRRDMRADLPVAAAPVVPAAPAAPVSPPHAVEPSPAPPPPSPTPPVKTSQPVAAPPIAAPNKAPAPAERGGNSAGFGGGGFGGSGAGVVPGAAPKGMVNGIDDAARAQTKSAANALNQPTAVNQGQPGPASTGALRPKPLRRSRANVGNGLAQGFGANPQAALDSWQGALSAAEQSPLWGENTGEQQANQALMAARESGMLDDLRARLEGRRIQAPQDVVTGRMLAAVYEFGASPEAALHERRRISGLPGATGEDWYALAQAEDRAHDEAAARAAYRHALESPVPPSSYHAGIARTRI